MPRGKKHCPKCKKINGPRAFFCKYCEEPFLINGKIMKREEVALVKAKKTEADYKQLFVEADDPNPDVARKYKEQYGDERFIWESKTDDFYFIMHVPRFCGIIVDDKRFSLCKYENKQERGKYSIVSRHRTFKSAARMYIRIKRGLKPRKSRKVSVDEQIERHMKRVRRAF